MTPLKIGKGIKVHRGFRRMSKPGRRFFVPCAGILYRGRQVQVQPPGTQLTCLKCLKLIPERGNSTMQEFVRERRFKAGYILRTKRVSGEEAGGGPPFLMVSAFTPSGVYIGNSKDAYRLVVRRGIKPEKISPESNICSIGYCAREQKWYGWSHRAIYGFAVGDMVKEGDSTASEGLTECYLKEHPEESTALPVGFTAHTMEDAKRMAVAFAHSVA